MIGVVVGKDEDGDDVSVVQAVFRPSNTASSPKGSFEEQDDIDRHLADAAKVRDIKAVNCGIILDALDCLGRQRLEDDKDIPRTQLLKEWNRRRAWYHDLDGEVFPNRDTTALSRLLKDMAEQGTVIVSAKNPVTIRLA